LKRFWVALLIVFVGAFIAPVAYAANNCTGATYYDSDSDTCIACPTGYDYNTDAGKTDITQCQIHCDGGTYVSVEYTQLEYIESTGTQWIDFTNAANIATPITEIKSVARVSLSQHTNTRQFLFSIGSSAVSHYVEVDGDGNFNLGPGSSGGLVHCEIGQVYEVSHIISATDSSLYINGSPYLNTIHYQSPTNISPRTLFRIGSYGAAASYIRIYSYQLYNTNSLILNLIPARRNSDGIIGMYDTVSGQFFTNSGMGEFIVGPDVDAIGECINVGAGYYAAASTVNYGSVGARTACPAGLTTVGYGHGADSANDCAHTLHIGDYVLYARRDKITTPSLNIKMSDSNVYYISLSPTGHSLSRLHLQYDGNQYTAYDDSLYYGERDFDTVTQIVQ